MFYIYRITNRINNKVYIGQTNNLSLRWSQHKYNANNNIDTQVITRAISKYGAKAFEFVCIASCKTQDDVNEIEIELIRQYDCRTPKGYNIDAGGQSPRSPETLKKISKALNKYYETHDSHLKGKIFPEEWRNNISKGSMGKPGTNVGKKFALEHRIKMARAQAGKENLALRRFSPEIEKEICRLYVEDEKSMYLLGREFDCHRSGIRSLLKRNGVEIRKSNYNSHYDRRFNIFSLEQERGMCDKYMSGQVTKADLSKTYGCGKTTVRDILLRHNVKL